MRDLPLPDRYRLTHFAKDLSQRVQAAANDIFANFEARSSDFTMLRKLVAAEPAIMARDIRAAFFGAGAPVSWRADEPTAQIGASPTAALSR